MSVRRVFFWFHLSVGLVVGLAIAFFASTGSLMAFQGQIIRFAERRVVVADRAQNAECLAPSALLPKVQAAVGAMPTSLELASDAHVPALVMTAPDRIYLVDPCSGALLQGGPSAVRAFFAHVRDLHRYAAVSGIRYQWLHNITTAGNLAFPFLILSGLVIWLPRQWKKAHLQNAVTIRKGLKARAREWNLHTVAGFWFALPLLVISLSGSVMAYDWVNGLLYRAAGTPPPAQGKEDRPKGTTMGDLALLDQLMPVARSIDPKWRSLTVRFPIVGSKAIPFVLDESNGSYPRQRTQMTLAKGGKLTKYDSFDKLPRGRQWRLYGRFLHTGEMLGVAGQALAFLSALTALLLVWTGFALSTRRFFAWQRRKARAKERVQVLETA